MQIEHDQFWVFLELVMAACLNNDNKKRCYRLVNHKHNILITCIHIVTLTLPHTCAYVMYDNDNSWRSGDWRRMRWAWETFQWGNLQEHRPINIRPLPRPLPGTHIIRGPHAALPRYQMFSQHCKLRCINQFAQLKVLLLVGGGPARPHMFWEQSAGRHGCLEYYLLLRK